MTKDSKVTSRISSKVYMELVTLAEKHRLSLSSMICHILTDYIRKVTGLGGR